MQHAWVIERRRLLVLVVVIALLGVVSGNWLLAMVLPMLGYIAWLLWQLYQLHAWLERDYSKKYVPESDGVWGGIVTKVLHMRKQDKMRTRRLSGVLKAYRETVTALPDAVVVVDSELEIQWANGHAEQLLGIKAKRDVGFRVTNLIRLPEFVAYLARPAQRALEIKAPADDDVMLAVRVVEYGQNQRLILARDISERVQMRNTLRAFVSNASHELRTPLTVTSGYIDLLKNEPQLSDDLREVVAQMRTQTDSMNLLISDLLTLSRLEGNALEAYEGRSVNVPKLLNQVVQDLHDTPVAQGREIELDVDKTLGLSGMERDVISIVINLIDNALKYTPAGAEIKASWCTDKSGCPLLCITDGGVGIQLSHLPKLSQRFYRVPASENTGAEGTGLGLAIVKHAAMRHGGELLIESKLGEGSRFCVRFPEQRYRKLKA